MMNSEVAIRAQNVGVRRGGRDVLHDVSWSVPAGSIAGLLGPSGCGKSTLLRAVVGVQRHVSGSLSVLDDAPGSAGLRRRVGYVTQAPAVYADLTVTENLSYFAAVQGAPRARVPEVLEQVDLGRAADQVVQSLSGGQRGRVSLASALLGDPELLVLDEPTVGLDPVLREDLWALFRRLADGGATLVVSSHVMDEAGRCDDLLLLRDGHVVAQCTPAALAERTGTDDLEQAFLRLVREDAR